MKRNELGSSFDKVWKFKGVSMAMFGSSWSVPSQILLNGLKEIEGNTMSYVDVDQDPYFADRFDIISLPSFLFFVNGEEVRRVIGAVSLEELLEEFNILALEYKDILKEVM